MPLIILLSTPLIHLISLNSSHLCSYIYCFVPSSVLNLCLIKLLTCGVIRSYNCIFQVLQVVLCLRQCLSGGNGSHAEISLLCYGSIDFGTWLPSTLDCTDQSMEFSGLSDSTCILRILHSLLGLRSSFVEVFQSGNPRYLEIFEALKRKCTEAFGIRSFSWRESYFSAYPCSTLVGL